VARVARSGEEWRGGRRRVQASFSPLDSGLERGRGSKGSKHSAVGIYQIIATQPPQPPLPLLPAASAPDLATCRPLACLPGRINSCSGPQPTNGSSNNPNEAECPTTSRNTRWNAVRNGRRKTEEGTLHKSGTSTTDRCSAADRRTDEQTNSCILPSLKA
jgi:hypothetical protein